MFFPARATLCTTSGYCVCWCYAVSPLVCNGYVHLFSFFLLFSPCSLFVIYLYLYSFLFRHEKILTLWRMEHTLRRTGLTSPSPCQVAVMPTTSCLSLTPPTTAITLHRPQIIGIFPFTLSCPYPLPPPFPFLSKYNVYRITSIFQFYTHEPFITALLPLLFPSLLCLSFYIFLISFSSPLLSLSLVSLLKAASVPRQHPGGSRASGAGATAIHTSLRNGQVKRRETREGREGGRGERREARRTGKGQG